MKVKIGDYVRIEQAWEDEQGNYHDDFATVVGIKENGELELKWENPEIDDFLKNSDGYTEENCEVIEKVCPTPAKEEK